MLRNTKKAYGSVAIALHWTVALLIIGMLGFGLYMVRQPLYDAGTFELYQIHKSVGFIVLAIVIIRLLWRASGVSPQMPSKMPWWERLAAHLGHVGLYALMFVMPLSGWMLVSASPLGVPTKFFNLFEIVHLPIPEVFGQKTQVSEFFTLVHGWAAYAFIALIVVHVGAALKHHFISKDRILKRMLSSKSQF